MADGYIKLHRSILNNPISKKPDYAWLWTVLLLKANHKIGKILWDNQKIELKPGQFITGREKLSAETGISQSKVYRILKYFESEQQIEQQKTNRFTVITIKNWKKYQSSKQQIEQLVNNKKTSNKCKSTTNLNNKKTQVFSYKSGKTEADITQMNNQRTTSEQPVNTNKNDKNDKNDKNTPLSKPKKVFDKDSIEIKLSTYLFEKIKKNNLDAKEPNIQSWAKHMDYMIRIDKRDTDIIKEIIDWCQSDSFWYTNILSTEKLREKFDQLLLKSKKSKKQKVNWDKFLKGEEK